MITYRDFHIYNISGRLSLLHDTSNNHLYVIPNTSSKDFKYKTTLERENIMKDIMDIIRDICVKKYSSEVLNENDIDSIRIMVDYIYDNI